MPRVTRAQLRAQAEGGPPIIHEDSQGTPTTEHPDYDPFSTEVSVRPPLVEIHSNTKPGPQFVQSEQGPIVSSSSNDLRKGKAWKNKLDSTLSNDEKDVRHTLQEVLEDECRGDTSSPNGVAAAELRKDEPVAATSQIPTETARPTRLSGAAMKEVNRSLSRSPQRGVNAVTDPAAKTPKFDPVVHSEIPSADEAAGVSNEDSFVASIKKRTSARMVESSEIAGEGPDSFVEDIISRSPSKYVPRIEDSVEAMDALEEAIEQVSEELPKTTDEGVGSPVKTSTPKAITPRKSLSAELQESSGKPPRPAGKSAELVASAEGSGLTTMVSLPSKEASHRTASRVSSGGPQPHSQTRTNFKRPSPSAKVATSAGQLEHTQPTAARPSTTRTATNRTSSAALSTSKPGFVPTKSAKPPTKSTFTLPGAAVSAKLKAQREERLKREEAEAARKRTEFKARPVPKAVTAAATGKGRISSVLPRETTASKARMSMIVAKKESEERKDRAGQVSEKSRGASAGSTKGASSTARKSVVPRTNQSSLSVAKTRTDASSATEVANGADKSTVPANSSAVRRITTSQTALSKTRTSSVQAREGLRNTKSTTTTATATSKGKEVFSRGKIADEELLKQKREKEEAARRARAEAAERGRWASREWAEKQRKRKTTMTPIEGEVKPGEDVKMTMIKDGTAKGTSL